MDYTNFLKLCEARRSIRYFADTPLKQEDILTLLGAARLAPSVGNTQPWKFHIILNTELRQRLMEASCYGNFVEGAGAFIVVTCDTTAQPASGEVLWNPKELEYSCMAAMTYLLLGATSMKLGSCWVSLHHGTAHEILNLPRNEIVVGGVMIGHYRAGEETPGTGHIRKTLTDSYKLYD